MFKVITGANSEVEKELNRLDEEYDYLFIKGCRFDDKYATMDVLVEYFNDCDCKEHE